MHSCPLLFHLPCFFPQQKAGSPRLSLLPVSGCVEPATPIFFYAFLKGTKLFLGFLGQMLRYLDLYHDVLIAMLGRVVPNRYTLAPESYLRTAP